MCCLLKNESRLNIAGFILNIPGEALDGGDERMRANRMKGKNDHLVEEGRESVRNLKGKLQARIHITLLNDGRSAFTDTTHCLLMRDR